MNILKHSDHILATPAGGYLVAVEPVSAGNDSEGGRLHYPKGARFRVKMECGDLLFCLDEQARSVTLWRRDAHCLQRETQPAMTPDKLAAVQALAMAQHIFDNYVWATDFVENQPDLDILASSAADALGKLHRAIKAKQ